MFSQELLDTYSRMVDPRLGIVRRIADIPLQPGEPRLRVLAASCTRPKYFLRNDVFPAPDADYAVPANGVGLGTEQALWRVLGEACERYTAGIYSESALITASRRELGSRALPVETLIGFSARQYERKGFPFVRFDPDAPIRWVRGMRLSCMQSCFIPATLVYLGYEVASPKEVFYPTLSTGMAAGRTLEQALLNGLCEVIERDAFMCTWLLRRKPMRVPLESLQRLLSARERSLIHPGRLESYATIMTTDIALPSALSILKPVGKCIAVVGAATHPDAGQAIVRSILEAYHTLNWSIYLERTERAGDGAAPPDFEDHVRYYLDERHFHEIAWLMQGAEREVASAPGDGESHQLLLLRALQCVAAAGYETYFVETTTEDVRQLGFRTVRVIIPGLHPLNVGFDTVHEDDRRLRRVAAHWNVAMPLEPNRSPHPFP